ncbi:MAG: Mini-ribonuclease 3 [Clostridia bacterium]|nr:Mini-ribonuclease 3 [Clostridia bacterium]
MKKEEVLQYSSLVLAYMGDAVYEKSIREYVVKQGVSKNGALHKKSIKYVSANGQSYAVKRLEEKLTEDELDVVRRGRNANPHSSAKNADIVDYKYATGFEALIGYLYLTEQFERMDEIIAETIEIINNK